MQNTEVLELFISFKAHFFFLLVSQNNLNFKVSLRLHFSLVEYYFHVLDFNFLKSDIVFDKDSLSEIFFRKIRCFMDFKSYEKLKRT